MNYWMATKNGEINAYGLTTTSLSDMSERIDGEVTEISKMEHALLSACHGDIELGIIVLTNLKVGK